MTDKICVLANIRGQFSAYIYNADRSLHDLITSDDEAATRIRTEYEYPGIEYSLEHYVLMPSNA